MSKSRHLRLLRAILSTRSPANIRWHEVEALLRYLGAEISEGSGSRVRVNLNGVRAVFHRPHPRPETDKGALDSLRRFLKEAGVNPP